MAPENPGNYPDMLGIHLAPGDSTIKVGSYTHVKPMSQGTNLIISGIEVTYPDHKEYFPTTTQITGEDPQVHHTYFIVTDFGSDTAPSGNHTIVVDSNPSSVDTIVDNNSVPGSYLNATNWTGVNGLLVGGTGDDDFEWQAPGQAVLVGGGGNNNLVGGTTEYAGFALPDALGAVGGLSRNLFYGKVDPAVLDQLIASESGLTLSGYFGNTNLVTKAANAILYGGSGDNHFTASGNGDQLFGGTGNNWFEVFPGSDGVSRVSVTGNGDTNATKNTLVFHGNGDFNLNQFNAPPSRSLVNVTATVSAVTITEQQYRASFTVTAHDITALSLAPASLSTIELADLSRLGLSKGVVIDLGSGSGARLAAPPTTPANRVILDGSVSHDQINVAAADAQEVAVKYERSGDVPIDELVVVRGLTANDQLAFDGRGGGDSYQIALDPSMAFTTNIVDSSRKGGDSLTVDGSAFNPRGYVSTVAVTDTSVAFLNTLYLSLGRTVYPLLEQSAFVTFNSQISNLTVMAADQSSNTITVNRPSGTTNTTVDGGPFNDLFQVTGIGSLTLDGKSGSDVYNLNLAPLHYGVTTSVTISDTGTTGADTLNFNDQKTVATKATDYEIKQNSVTRTAYLPAYPQFLTAIVAVTFSGVATVIVNSGVGANTIDIESTALGTATTINTAAGNNSVNVVPTGKRLDQIAGKLTVNGGPGFNGIYLKDENADLQFGAAFITVTPGVISRRHTALFFPTTTQTIDYSNNVSEITIDTPGTTLTVDTSQVYTNGISGLLDHAPANRGNRFQISYGVLPTLYFEDRLSNLAIVLGGVQSIFDVYDTPFACPTSISVGFQDRVNVHATTETLDIEAAVVFPNYTGRVYLGDPSARGGSLANFQGAVTVGSQGGLLALDIDYSADRFSVDSWTHHAVLRYNKFTVGPVAINFGVGVASLTVHSGGDTGSDVTVADIPAGIKTVLHGGVNTNAVNVQALSSGALEIDAGSGNETVTLGATYRQLDLLSTPNVITVNGGTGSTESDFGRSWQPDRRR